MSTIANAKPKRMAVCQHAILPQAILQPWVADQGKTKMKMKNMNTNRIMDKQNPAIKW